MIFTDTKGKVVVKPENEIIHPRISVYAVILNDQDQILMIRSKWNTNWILPGGGVEEGESIEEAVIRECMEEVGYRIVLDEKPFLTGRSHFYDDVLHHKFYSSSNYMFIGRIVAEERIEGGIEGEVDEISWVKLSELNESNCHHTFTDVVKKVQEQKEY